MSNLEPTSSVIVMIEKIMSPGEYTLPNQNPTNTGAEVNAAGNYINKLAQPKANWKRFTTRHRGGGMILFADGHVAWYSWTDVQPPVDPLDPNDINANQPGKGLIWNPATGVGEKSSD
jgi:prepilin-type processing-associated H-X9-DG protein